MQAPLWDDPDRHHVTARPSLYFSGGLADAADNMALRPLSRAFTVPVGDESMNVNSVDEVPNSAWFTNRIGVAPMTPKDVGLGPCAEGPRLDPERGPWTVVAAKPDGVNPGFFVKAPDGVRYLLKFDGHEQPLRATSAEVIGSKLYHAFGYNVPCNEVVLFSPALLTIAPDATRKNPYGEKLPITKQDIDTVLAAAVHAPDGRLRAAVSRFVPGKPLGPFRYLGTRDDDPNDVIPHDRRRELRGGRLMAAWINHYDSREQNSLDVWVEGNGPSYIRHYYLDWGDSLGSLWPSDHVTRRLGYAGYFDYDQVVGDLVTLGAYPRPWKKVVPASEPQVFGYLGDENFVGSEWRGAIPNPAFQRMSDHDAAWTARIMARFTDDHVRAAVAAGDLPADLAQSLTRTLIGRRDRILAEYIGKLSPLSRIELARRDTAGNDQALCFDDDAMRLGMSNPATTRYGVRLLAGSRLQPLAATEVAPDPRHPDRTCLTLPVDGRRPSQLVAAGAPDGDPLRYGVLEIDDGKTTARIHTYDLGPTRGFRIVAIERPRTK
jgi:nitroreductase